MGPADEDQWGRVAGSATRLGVGDPVTSHWVWLPSPPRKLPVLSDSSTREAQVQAPESRCSVLTGAASTMDTSRALLLFLLLGKSPAQPLPHWFPCSADPQRPLLLSLQPPEEGSSTPEPLLEFSNPVSPWTQKALPRAQVQKSPSNPPAGNFQISLRVQKPLLLFLIPNGFLRPRI